MKARARTATIALTALCIVLLAASCVSGSPPQFKSTGNAWTVPVEGFLADGQPVVSVTIDGKGPYLFSVQFDGMSTIHPDLGTELKLWRDVDLDGRMFDRRSGNSVRFQTTHFQVNALQMGELTIGRVHILAMANPSSFRGQQIQGTIGRDMLGQTTIWHLDRDRGLFQVANQGHFQPPAHAQRIDFKLRFGEIFAYVGVNDRQLAYMRVLFNGPTSLRPSIARRAGLARRADGLLVGRQVTVGQTEVDVLIFDHYYEPTGPQSITEGELGAQFFNRYNVTVNLHEQAIWLTPRRRQRGPGSARL